MNCIFCKIAKGEIESDVLYEDDICIAFNDANPQAPTHFLVIPKEHIKSADDIDKSHKELIGHLLYVASDLAKKERLDNGYRVINNCGPQGGQTVDHLHYHVLGGRNLQWPPG